MACTPARVSTTSCEYLYEHARRETSLLKRVGEYINRAKDNGERGNSVHLGLAPADILITVAGD